MKMIGNRHLRALSFLAVAIHCFILLFLCLFRNTYVTIETEINFTTTKSTPLQLILPSPAPNPPTVVPKSDLNDDHLPDNILSKLNKYLKSSKVSALKGPRLDRLWNVWNITYSIEPNRICQQNDENVSAIIVVVSSPGNFQSRNSIRSTWGSNLTSDVHIRMVYFVGLSTDFDIDRKLKLEDEKYGDIIQGDFVDTYRNLTLKSVLLLRWASTRCPNARFVLKVDDDVFINPSNFLALIETHKHRRLSIFGREAYNWRPVRSKSSAYYVEENVWTSSIYPDFVTGPAYLLTMDSVPVLLKYVSKVPFFFLEDVYITGILAAKASVARIHLPKFRNTYVPVNPCVYHKIISIHHLKPTVMVAAWDILNRHQTLVTENCWKEKCVWELFGVCMAKETKAVDFLTLSNSTDDQQNSNLLT
ncbi:hypothetical protein CHUAL_012973 [Chamberlinius hualienensis]